jgi:hypothetical protein
MKSIPRAGAVVLALATVALLAPGAALGGRKVPVVGHHVSLTGVLEAVSSTGKIGVSGTKDTDAGLLDGTVSGSPRWSGALRQVATWGPDLTLTSTGTAFSATGSLRFTLAGKFTPGTTSLALNGTLTVTGGTGSYNHARGTLHVTGGALLSSVASGSPKVTVTLTGTLRYPRAGRPAATSG